MTPEQRLSAINHLLAIGVMRLISQQNKLSHSSMQVNGHHVYKTRQGNGSANLLKKADNEVND